MLAKGGSKRLRLKAYRSDRSVDKRMLAWIGRENREREGKGEETLAEKRLRMLKDSHERVRLGRKYGVKLRTSGGYSARCVECDGWIENWSKWKRYCEGCWKEKNGGG